MVAREFQGEPSWRHSLHFAKVFVIYNPDYQLESTMTAPIYRVVRGKYYGCYQLQGGAWKVLWLLNYKVVRGKYYGCSTTEWCVESTMAAISYRGVRVKYFFCYQLQGSAWKVLWVLTATGWCLESTIFAISYRAVRGKYYGCYQLQGGA